MLVPLPNVIEPERCRSSLPLTSRGPCPTTHGGSVSTDVTSPLLLYVNFARHLPPMTRSVRETVTGLYPGSWASTRTPREQDRRAVNIARSISLGFIACLL